MIVLITSRIVFEVNLQSAWQIDSGSSISCHRHHHWYDCHCSKPAWQVDSGSSLESQTLRLLTSPSAVPIPALIHHHLVFKKWKDLKTKLILDSPWLLLLH